MARLLVAFILLLGACSNREAADRTARIAQLEKENAALKAELEKRSSVTPKVAPTLKAGPVQAVQATVAESSHHPDDAALIQQLRATIADLRKANAEIEERAGKLDGQVLSMMADQKRLAEAEAFTSEKVAAAGRIVEEAQKELRARSERVAQLEKENRVLKDEAGSQSQRSSQLARTLAELEDIERRRENYVNSILRRYREVTEQYRVLGGTLDNRRSSDGLVSTPVDLSRVNEAINMAEEDLKQLRSLSAQAARAQKKLAAR